jgi:hypothetical protein
MHKRILISLFLLLSIAVVNAQHKKYNQGSDSTVITDDESTDDNTQTVVDEKVKDTLFIDTTVYYNLLEMSPDSVEAWKNQKAFAYVKNLDSLLKARQKKEANKEKAKEEEYDNSPGWFSGILSSGVFKAFLWIFAIAFVLFILYHLFLAEGTFRKKTKSANAATPNVEEEVITSESDFEVMIRQAVQSGNYRLAVRYQYLQTLHKLADKQLIQLANDKTNYQYVREISNQNYQNDFAALTLNYEYVWYGEFAIEEGIYRKIETGFSQFNSKF